MAGLKLTGSELSTVWGQLPYWQMVAAAHLGMPSTEMNRGISHGVWAFPFAEMTLHQIPETYHPGLQRGLQMLILDESLSQEC